MARRIVPALLVVATAAVTALGIIPSAPAAPAPKAIKVATLGSNPHGFVTHNGLAAVGATVYFAGRDAVHGRELWAADGNSAHLVADLRPGKASSDPQGMVRVGTSLFFFAKNSAGVDGLWVLPQGGSPQRLADIAPSAGSYDDITDITAALGKRLVFAGGTASDGEGLWISDGTPGGTRPLHQLTTAGFTLSDMTTAGSHVFFYADDGKHGRELWVSDGTGAGTHMVKDIAPGRPDGSGEILAAVGSRALFSAYRHSNGEDASLWVSDGTAKGTKLLRTSTGKALTGNFTGWAATKGRIAYIGVVDSSTTVQWFYRSDGTPKGTRLIPTPLRPQPGSFPFGLYEITAYAKGVIFQGYHSRYGMETWVSDGTAAGTRMLPERVPGPVNLNAIQPASVYGKLTGWPGFATAGKWVYYQAPFKVNGRWSMQLARTDGRRVQQLTHLAPGKQFDAITPAGGKVYVAVSTVHRGTHRELWVWG